MTKFLVLDGILLLLLVVTSLTVVRLANLFSATIMLGLYSLLMALVWLNLDAVDVAFTEAAVGGGISTILLIGVIVSVGSEEKKSEESHALPLLIVTLTTAALIYGTLDMPPFGDPKAPPQVHVRQEYVAQTVEKTGTKPTPNNAPAKENYFHGRNGSHLTVAGSSARGPWRP
jgi:multicomponent Na+:H+ antiporter subunit B